MSKLPCICGHIIVDQTDSLAYKASFVRDQDWEARNKSSEDIAAFVGAVKNGSRNLWLNSYFGSDAYSALSDSGIVNDIILRHTVGYESTMYQCEKCGRLHVQAGNTNRFAVFAPEDKNFSGLFKGLSGMNKK